MSALYDNAKPATLTEIRKLRIGDIVEAYYKDSEQPVRELVIACCESNRLGDIEDIKTIRLKAFGKRRQDGPGLNTNKFRLVGKVEAGSNWVSSL